jgi:hypothetical protein
LAAFVRALPVCSSELSAQTAAVLQGGAAEPGSHVVLTGHLSVVAFGPPCDNAHWWASNHCGLTWSLWGSAAHPVEFDDMISGDFAMLEGSALPLLVNQRDVEAAQALGDVVATVQAVAADKVCQEDDDPGSLVNRYRPPCTVPFSEFALTVQEICRNEATSHS